MKTDNLDTVAHQSIVISKEFESLMFKTFGPSAEIIKDLDSNEIIVQWKENGKQFCLIIIDFRVK